MNHGRESLKDKTTRTVDTMLLIRTDLPSHHETKKFHKRVVSIFMYPFILRNKPKGKIMSPKHYITQIIGNYDLIFKKLSFMIQNEQRYK